MSQSCPNPSSVVFDVDGVVWISGGLEPSVRQLIDTLSQVAFPFCLLTNDCSVSKMQRFEALQHAGLRLNSSQLTTAGEVANEWLIASAVRNIMYLGAPAALLDVAKGILVKDCGPVDAVVIGDLFAHYNRQLLDDAAKALCSGATPVALQRNKRWSNGRDWFIDNGFWVAGLEYVTGTKAVVTGKPNVFAYTVALHKTGGPAADPSRALFISDDIDADLRGAKAAGMQTAYFGSAHDLPEWIDYRTTNGAEIHSVLTGDRRCARLL